MSRTWIGLLAAAALLATTAAAPASAQVQDPPTIPSSTAKAKQRCGTVNRNGYGFKVWLIRGGISCSKARKVVRPGRDNRGFTYFDWTKGGNGKWSDVWSRRNRTVVGAIIQGF